MFQSVPLDQTRAQVQDSKVEEFLWELSVIKRSFLCIHECVRGEFEHMGV